MATQLTAQVRPLDYATTSFVPALVPADTTGNTFISTGREIIVGFNADFLNDIQTITVTGTPTGGTFTLTFGGQTTAAIAFNASAAAVQTALAALSSIGAGNVQCSGGPLPGTAVVVQFTGTLAAAAQAVMTHTDSFTGGASPAAAIAHTITGAGTAHTITVTGTPDAPTGRAANLVVTVPGGKFAETQRLPQMGFVAGTGLITFTCDVALMQVAVIQAPY